MNLTMCVVRCKHAADCQDIACRPSPSWRIFASQENLWSAARWMLLEKSICSGFRRFVCVRYLLSASQCKLIEEIASSCVVYILLLSNLDSKIDRSVAFLRRGLGCQRANLDFISSILCLGQKTIRELSIWLHMHELVVQYRDRGAMKRD